MADEIRIFISYSHEDEDLRKELEGHLAFLSEYGDPIWHDRKIPAGSEWANVIDANLNSCNIILLLISASFLRSYYCYKIEFKRAMERHRDREATVIPIIVRDVFWEFGDLKELQALPKDGKAVLNDYWRGNKDAAFRNVAEGIQKVVEELARKPQIIPPVPNHIQNMPIGPLESNCFDELYHELGKLDFRKQKKILKQFLESRHRVGAFLIHGEPECGQRWLLNRFLKQISGSSTGKPPCKFSFERKGGGRSLEDLWNNLAEWSGLTDPSSLGKLVEAVHTLWQTQTVIFILRGLHEIEHEYIEEFIQLFWQPLAEKAKSQPCRYPHYCLLFFIDDRGCEWNFRFAKHLDSDWEPRIPIELERLARFPKDELLRWIEAGVDILPSTLTINDIVEDCEGGLPELVLKRICKLCGDNWHRREKAWIMY